MVIGEHAVIRGAEPDDASALCAIYNAGQMRACLLNQQREFIAPTVDEISIMLAGGPDGRPNDLNTIEDRQGAIRGFCALRAAPNEPLFGQLVVMACEESDYHEPVCDEAAHYLIEEAFLRRRLHKVLAQSLEHESAFAQFLVRHGFQSDGVQRQVVYSGGRWLDLESFTLFASAVASSHLSNEVSVAQ